MSRAKLEKAHDHIRAKEYVQARAILKTLPNDPTAQKWMAKLDEIDPFSSDPFEGHEPLKRKSETKPNRVSRTTGCLLIAICGVLAWGVLTVDNQTQQTLQQASSSAGATLHAAGMVVADVTTTPSGSTASVQQSVSSATANSTITETATLVGATATMATDRPHGYVHRNDYGDAWPLTVDDGIVACVQGIMIIFLHGGTTYAVNGTAMSWADEYGYKDIEPIWRANPNGITPKVPITPIIDLGFSLCNASASDVIQPGPQSTAPASALNQSNLFTCNAVDDLNCSDFSSQGQANDHIAVCGDEDKLDTDFDGQACETN